MPRPAKPTLSHRRKPPEMSLETWQRELRRQFGREQRFTLRNLGPEAVFSEFQVSNPQNASTYRVAIRGVRLAKLLLVRRLRHQCAGHLQARRVHAWAARAAGPRRHRSGAGLRRRYSEVVLHYGAKREVRFRRGSACPRALAALAASYFDARHTCAPRPLRRSSRSSRRRPASITIFAATTTSWGSSPRCAMRAPDHKHRRGLSARRPRRGRGAGCIKCQLYEYQREGALFAARAGRSPDRRRHGARQDDPGHRRRRAHGPQFGVERVLVVCPTSLKHQWEREIARFTDRTTDGHRRPARRAASALRRRRRPSSRSPTTTPCTATST